MSIDKPEFAGNEEILSNEEAVQSPETKEKVTIPKKSRLAVWLAFHYRKGPELYNYEQEGIHNLDEYLQWYFRKIKAHEDGIAMPDNCITPEDCLQEMSNEEIHKVINDWKEQAPEESESLDEYLQYLLGKEKPEEVAASVETPNISLAPENVSLKESSEEILNTSESRELKFEFDKSQLPNVLAADVTLSSEKKKRFFVNLPPAAKAAEKADIDALEQSFKQVVEISPDNFYPVYTVLEERLRLNLGDKKNRKNLQLVTEIPAEEVVKITGATKDEVQEYLKLRGKVWAALKPSERQTVDAFQDKLKAAKMPGFVEGKQVGLNQKFRDVAVLNEWKKNIGQERYRELEEKAKTVAKPNRRPEPVEPVKEKGIEAEPRVRTAKEQRERDEKEFAEFLALKNAIIAATNPLGNIPAEDIVDAVLTSTDNYDKQLKKTPNQKS